MPAGTINVTGNVVVTPGALLDATSPGDPSSGPLVPATVIVGGNVNVGAGAVLLFGCSPFISCPQAVTYDQIDGSVNATQALGVVVHSTAIGGNLSIKGGGGGTSTCANIPAPWSSDPNLDHIPVYSDSEDNTVGGNLSVFGLQTCWMGALRNQVGGNVSLTGNSFGDPDAMETTNNLVSGNMTCYANQPTVQYGDSGSTPNIVGKGAFGECGFNALSHTGSPGYMRHVSVAAASLGTYTGTRVTLSQHSIEFGKTSSGDTLVGTQGTAKLTGNGLTGPTVTKSLATIAPDGSGSLLSEDLCTCSMNGHHGMVTILAVGTVTASGAESGTFQLIATNGAFKMLAGWGTFTSAGQPKNTLSITEYLGLG